MGSMRSFPQRQSTYSVEPKQTCEHTRAYVGRPKGTIYRLQLRCQHSLHVLHGRAKDEPLKPVSTGPPSHNTIGASQVMVLPVRGCLDLACNVCTSSSAHPSCVLLHSGRHNASTPLTDSSSMHQPVVEGLSCDPLQTEVSQMKQAVKNVTRQPHPAQVCLMSLVSLAVHQVKTHYLRCPVCALPQALDPPQTLHGSVATARRESGAALVWWKLVLLLLMDRKQQCCRAAHRNSFLQ